VSVVSGIVADLDTTVMFATSGTLNAQSETDVFAYHRQVYYSELSLGTGSTRVR
jgi:hypothetical protein